MDRIDTTQYQYPPYNIVLPFERNFYAESAQKWMENDWHMAFYYSAVYVIAIFVIQRIMTNFKPFKLNTLLLLWNAILSIFSMLVFFRTAPEFYSSVAEKGLHHSVCDNRYLTEDKVAGFWSFIFVLSKLLEFGDTIFIVLRKQPLIFLHWYHHILTLLYSWYAYKEITPSSRWFIVMNSLIHWFMYSYYAFKAMKFRIPRVISVVITMSQIVQMVAGCFISLKTWQFIFSDIPCSISRENVTVFSLMYLSYFILFTRFFYLTYLSKSKKSKAN